MSEINTDVSVTWKWMTGILVGLCLTFLGWVWVDHSNRLGTAEGSITSLKADQAAIHSKLDTKFDETFRRLDRIERGLDAYKPQTLPPMRAPGPASRAEKRGFATEGNP